MINEDRKDHPDIEYFDDITKVIASLKSHESGRYTKLGRNLQRIEELTKEMNELKKEIKDDTKELIGDLFDADDAAMTRVVETVSFTFTMSKDPEETTTYQYSKVLKELETHLTPSLIAVLTSIKAKFKSVVQKTPSLSLHDKSLGEGIGDLSFIKKIKSFFHEFYNSILSWGKKYDNDLNRLKDMASELSEDVVDGDAGVVNGENHEVMIDDIVDHIQVELEHHNYVIDDELHNETVGKLEVTAPDGSRYIIAIKKI